MTDQQHEIAPKQSLLRALANPHFLIVAAILLVTAAGWGVVSSQLKLFTEKYAVPWPAGVEVDEEFNMTAMPDKMGPFEYVSGDGVLFPAKVPGTYVKDGKPDGQASIDEETMALLKIGTATDSHNLPRRRSNWVSIRIYRDTRKPVGDPLRYWRLEVYYYTGGVDLVPHVPEKCAVASGADWISTTPLPIVLPGESEPWGPKPLPLRRALFSKTEQGFTQQFLQYYIFSFNGRPMYDRNQVRWALGNLFVKHAYFAKIQFAPLPVPYWLGDQKAGRLPTPAEADKGAADFAEHFMPRILEMLPMPSDVAKLDAAASNR